jgi:hypothetical protein
MSKAGNRDLRTQLIRSAETARRHDPQLAAVYYDQMVHKGAVHTKALCVVAAKLAERAWTTLNRGTPYELRDIDNNTVDPATAKQIIAEHYTVPEDVRRRRRSKKSGKAPHNDQTRQKRSTRRPSHRTASRPAAPGVKTRPALLTPEAT